MLPNYLVVTTTHYLRRSTLGLGMAARESDRPSTIKIRLRQTDTVRLRQTDKVQTDSATTVRCPLPTSLPV